MLVDSWYNRPGADHTCYYPQKEIKNVKIFFDTEFIDDKDSYGFTIQKLDNFLKRAR